MQSTQFIMDTVVEQQAFGPNAAEAVRAVEALLRELEQRQSLFLASSEVSAINKNAGVAPAAVSEQTFAVIERAVEFAKASNGDFDITIAPLKTLWNVQADPPRVPEDGEIAALLPLVDYRGIELNREARTVFLKNKGQSIDLGGVAKGYAAELCVTLYEESGVSGYINVGGNIAVAGEKRSENAQADAFTVGIRAPRGEIAYFGALPLRSGTIVATSGDYERYFESGGVRYHHLLDPQTGWPAQNGLISVSVVSMDGAQADFLSTVLFLRGKNGLDSLRGTYAYEYIAVDADLNVMVSPGLRESFRLTAGEYGYHLLS